ncbi:MAG TPA: DUF3073 family protein [Microbacteriaceae bacterium]|nr:DUF3073 family protein [Microbacteriaceae bacterium]
MKSYSPEVDYGALERELAAKSHTEDNDYAEWAAHGADEDYSDYSSQNKRA